jgi:phosphotriesterase-related protein
MKMAVDILYSVLGEVDALEMRWIHPHEHLLISMEEYHGETITKYQGNMEYARRQITEMLKELRQYGVNGLIDPTPMGIGRDEAYVEFAKSVSSASGVHIFLATGLYVPSNWPQWAKEWTADQIGSLFTKELEYGIGDTGIRPCFIKAAVGGEFAANEEKMLTACAIAQKRTGSAIHIHATGCRRNIVDFLTALGVDPSRIYLAHIDMNTSEEEFLWLAERHVRFVTTNWDFPYHMDQAEARRLLNVLIEKGYLDQILISIDFALAIESRWSVGIWTWDNPDRTSYAYLHTGVIPKLRVAGFTDAQIEKIMHDNPLEMLRRK